MSDVIINVDPTKGTVTYEVPLPANLTAALKGGPGSGNFGHAGRPGQRGGSAPGSGVPGAENEPGQTFFHGTSSAYTESILRHGLEAGRAKGATAWAEQAGWGSVVTRVKVAGQEVSVFIAPSKEMALTYGDYAARLTGQEAVVFEVRVPESHAAKVKKDENSEGLRFEGAIPPEWIVGLVQVF